MNDKDKLRTRLRKLRRDHVAALPDATRGLLFLRPPGPVAALAPEGSAIGLYHALPAEAPAQSYARWFFENGRSIALPWFADQDAPMQFRAWSDPYDDEGLEVGPFGMLQPTKDSQEVVPDAVFVPLIGFTAQGQRLGQGGGHYDRWLAANPSALALGLAWDCQLVESLPTEPHDRPLRGVITPTRFYEGSA